VLCCMWHCCIEGIGAHAWDATSVALSLSSDIGKGAVEAVSCQLQDAKWKAQDIEQKVLDHIMRWAKEKRSEAVRDEIKKVCRCGVYMGREHAVQLTV
jgi:hypothetical protein